MSGEYRRAALRHALRGADRGGDADGGHGRVQQHGHLSADARADVGRNRGAARRGGLAGRHHRGGRRIAHVIAGVPHAAADAAVGRYRQQRGVAGGERHRQVIDRAAAGGSRLGRQLPDLAPVQRHAERRHDDLRHFGRGRVAAAGPCQHKNQKHCQTRNRKTPHAPSPRPSRRGCRKTKK